MAVLNQITSPAAYKQFLSSFPTAALLVIYFHAPWAQPCKQMSAVLEALASTYPDTSPPSIGFVSIDAEELTDISEEYDVTSVPYLVLSKNGTTVETVSGSDAAKVRAAVEKHASTSAASTFNLPPAQKVTKPAEEPDPAKAPSSVAAASTNGSNTPAKNLSGYVPPENPSQSADQDPSAPVDKDALFERLGKLVKAAPVMLFMKGTPSAPQCGFSRQTVGLLRDRNIRYGFFNILADDDVRQGLKEFSDWPTFPQLYVDGELVGGLDIVKEEFASNPDFLMDYAVGMSKPDATSSSA